MSADVSERSVCQDLHEAALDRQHHWILQDEKYIYLVHADEMQTTIHLLFYIF